MINSNCIISDKDTSPIKFFLAVHQEGGEA